MRHKRQIFSSRFFLRIMPRPQPSPACNFLFNVPILIYANCLNSACKQAAYVQLMRHMANEIQLRQEEEEINDEKEEEKLLSCICIYAYKYCMFHINLQSFLGWLQLCVASIVLINVSMSTSMYLTNTYYGSISTVYFHTFLSSSSNDEVSYRYFQYLKANASLRYIIILL